MKHVSLTRRNLLRRLCSLVVALLLTAPAWAKDAPLAVIDWPETGTAVVHFTFGKLKQLDGSGAMRAYMLDTSAQNLSARVIPEAKFNVYLFDKNKVRVGEDTIVLNNVGPGETVRFDTTIMASGSPVSITIHGIAPAAKVVTLTVNSIPQGAVLKLDGADQGPTPRIISVGTGKHVLIFTMDGFTTGTFPLEIGPDEVSGGTVNYQLGGSAFDSIEMRDGSVLNGDLLSLSGMDVEIRVGGIIQHLDRNKIKSIILVQREAPTPNLPPATVPTQ